MVKVTLVGYKGMGKIVKVKKTIVAKSYSNLESKVIKWAAYNGVNTFVRSATTYA